MLNQIITETGACTGRVSNDANKEHGCRKTKERISMKGKWLRKARREQNGKEYHGRNNMRLPTFCRDHNK
jgi:hypothetical protein